jgi:iron complex outermembrane receptor protein
MKNNRNLYEEFLFFLSLFLLVFCLISTVQAESPSEDSSNTRDEPVRLEEIVVVSEKEKGQFQTGDVDFGILPSFSTVISRDAFEGRIEDLSEVLKKEKGIQIRRSGGLGSFSQVSIRGSSSDQVMIYVDGILINDASGGGVDLSNISLFDVEAIEVFRGFTPVNFGTASIGGAVNIKTVRPEKGLTSSASAGTGAFGTRQLGAFINHKPSEWDYLISFDYLESDNDFTFENDRGTPLNPADDKTEKRENAQFDQSNVLTKLGYDVSDTFRIDILDQYFDKSQAIPDWRNNPDTKARLDTQRNILALKLTGDRLGETGFNAAATTSLTWKQEEYDDSLGQIGLGRQHSRETTTRIGEQVYIEHLSDLNVLGLNLDFNHEQYEPEDLLYSKTPNDSTRDLFNLGLQDTVLLLDGQFLVTPSWRMTLIKDELESATSVYGIKLESSRRTNTYGVPQIGIQYRPSDWLALKSNLGTYVREPSFFELFGDRGIFIGNTSLTEESGVNFDIGFQIDKRFDTPSIHSISLTAAYFKSDVDDLIARVFDARGVGKSINLPESEIQGLEAGFQVNLLKHFRLLGNATFQDATNQSDIPAFKGKNLPGRWEQSYLGRVETVFENWTVYLEHLSDKNLYYDTANLLKAEDKQELNAGIQAVFDSWMLTFEIKNIQDKQYEDFNGFPMPGRAWYFTVKFYPFGMTR